MKKMAKIWNETKQDYDPYSLPDGASAYENDMNKQELMKKLIDLYEQRKYVHSTDESQHAIDEHIEDLEETLKELL